MDGKEETLKKSPVAESNQLGKKRGIGWLAVDAGLITEKQLAAAVHEHEETGKQLLNLFQELYGLSSEALQYLMAEDAVLNGRI